ncbi:MAG: Xaa-Pro dipeptidase [Anaerofustis stercorihominis]|nr:Xaa-Pro dipeptidase [Anaerofustis stercorihominis]
MLSDNHIHLILDGKNYKNALLRHKDCIDEGYIRSVFEGYEKRGTEFLRDGGDNLGVGLYAKKFASEYGITYLSPNFAIHKKGYYGDILGKSYEDYDEFEMLLDELEDTGADFVKFMASSIMDFSAFGKFEGNMLPLEDIKEAIGRIKARGYCAMVHVNSDSSVRTAIQCGADSIEHGFYMSKETIHILADSDCVWVPTICAVGNLMDNKSLRGADRGVLKNIVNLQIENVRYALDIGAKVALGTDAGSYGVTHEEGIRNEEYFFGLCDDDYKRKIQDGNIYLKKLFGGE